MESNPYRKLIYHFPTAEHVFPMQKILHRQSRYVLNCTLNILHYTVSHLMNLQHQFSVAAALACTLFFKKHVANTANTSTMSEPIPHV